MKYITIINFIVRIFGTISIFVFINVQNDFLKLAAINSSVQIFIGLIGLLLVINKFSVKLIYPGFNQIKRQLRHGAELFKSTIAINIYTNSNTFILGLLTNEQVVGYYSAADKIRIAAHNLLGPVSQTIFPHVNYIVRQSKEKLLKFNSKLIRLQGLFGFLISVSIFLLAGPISKVLFGIRFTESINVLKILAWLPFVISISNVYGIQTMLPLNYEKQFLKIVSLAAVVDIILLLSLVPGFMGTGAAVSFLITEIFVTIVTVVFCRIKGIRFFNYGV